MFSDATLRSTSEVQRQQYMPGVAAIESALPHIICRELWLAKLKRPGSVFPGLWVGITGGY